jgi:hypothetical protein
LILIVEQVARLSEEDFDALIRRTQQHNLGQVQAPDIWPALQGRILREAQQHSGRRCGMFRIYDLLEDMAKTLTVPHRVQYTPPHYEEEAQPAWKKASLTIPYGLDFNTWHSQERRRLLQDCALLPQH